MKSLVNALNSVREAEQSKCEKQLADAIDALRLFAKLAWVLPSQDKEVSLWGTPRYAEAIHRAVKLVEEYDKCN